MYKTNSRRAQVFYGKLRFTTLVWCLSYVCGLQILLSIPKLGQRALRVGWYEKKLHPLSSSIPVFYIPGVG